ncbi:fimbrial biogenesis outer membrane usher protein, partial [Salmonella enterica subsp. houtenae]|nr:fimbrial biogenesis outer membrane usher protein [Salmonella enterica subsp. houtenae]
MFIVFFLMLLFLSQSVSAKEYTFDKYLLNDSNVDLIGLENETHQHGMYFVDIYVNGNKVDSRNVYFEKNKGIGKLYPCLSKAKIARYGINTDGFNTLKKDANIIDFTKLPSGVSYVFNIREQELDISLPQNMMSSNTDLAPVDVWDDGINAFLLNYNANADQAKYYSPMKSLSNSAFIKLDPGFNFGAWRLRSQVSWSKVRNGKFNRQKSYSFLERGLYGIKSKLTIGDTFTHGDVFNALPVRGFLLGTDLNMISSKERSFFSVVHGIAASQARVIVRQDGYVIYNEVVSPGPFNINVYPRSNGGNLDVIVYENNGAIKKFTVPYQVPAIVLPQGRFNYNLAIGKYNGFNKWNSDSDSQIVQISMIYGLPYDITIYSGSENYHHYNGEKLGIGASLGSLGALSLDVLNTNGNINKHKVSGNIWKMKYSKAFSMRTNIILNYKQYSQEKANELNDILSFPWVMKRKRSVDINLNKDLGGFGTGGIYYDYNQFYHSIPPNYDFGLEYDYTLYKDIDISINWGMHRYQSSLGNKSHHNEQSISFSLNIPFSKNISTSYQFLKVSQGPALSKIGIHGNAYNRKMNWRIDKKFTPRDADQGTDFITSWSGNYGDIGAGYSKSHNYRSLNINLSGGLVTHRHGITFGRRISNSAALIDVPSVSGVFVYGSTTHTDCRGYALYNWLTPYRYNNISLDPTEIPKNVDISKTDQFVVPSEGAIVTAKFNPRIGAKALIKLILKNNKVVPLGAIVKGSNGMSGIVGDNGYVYLTAVPVKGFISAKWSTGECKANYKFNTNVEDEKVKYSI